MSLRLRIVCDLLALYMNEIPLYCGDRVTAVVYTLITTVPMAVATIIAVCVAALVMMLLICK